MNKYPLWRYILLAVLIVWGILYALPNLYGDDPAIQVSPLGSAVLDSTVETKINTALEAQHLASSAFEKKANSFLIRFKDTETQLKAQDVIQATLGQNYNVALNLAPRTPTWLQAINAQPMKLGLDLRGGIHFLLAVQTDKMIQEQIFADLHGIGSGLQEAKIRYAGIEPNDKGIVVHFREDTAQSNALTYLIKNFPQYSFVKEGLNLKGTILPENLIRIQNEAVDQNITILRNRVNELGVAEPVISRQGASEISVDLPGLQDSARAKEMIGKMATIRLQLVDIEHDAETASQTGIIPFGSKLYHFDNRSYLLKSQVVLRGSSIISATTSMGDDGRPSVQVRVSGGEVTQFNRITGENVGKPLAVVYVETVADKSIVNGKVVTTHRQKERMINVATIQTALGNNFQITGLESMKYAQDLALLLRSGAYSAPLDFVQERVIGPSLGKDNIAMGIRSTEVGALLVIVFMVMYYHLFGLIADLALLLDVIFIVAIMSVLGATLTLPGIAGIVLTIGMAVDANVLINERIREELRKGMSPQASIHAGYERAFSTIVDANVSTLIVAVILFSLGSGPVQGFAVTLIIGLLTSMVTAIFFTRAIVNLIYGYNRKLKWLSIGIKPSKNIEHSKFSSKSNF